MEQPWTNEELAAMLAAQRETGRTPREREIIREMQAIAHKHQRACQQELEPLIKELARLEMLKPIYAIRERNE